MAGSEREGAEASTLGRRRFLALLGQAAAGAGAGGLLAGCGGSADSARTKAARPRKYTEVAVASPATAGRETQHFHSRPDLRPPRITIARAERRADGLVFTETHGGSGQQGPLLIDGSGRLVWFLPVSDHGTTRSRAFNVRVQTYQGRRLMTFFRGAVVSGHGQGHYELWDDSYQRVAEVHGANGYLGDLHEFLITDRGTALFTCYGQANGRIPNHSGPGTRVGAFFYGVAQEVDIATGKLLFQWRSIDHVPVQDSYHQPPPSNPRVGWDYFHINSISVDPSDNNLLISSRNTWTVYKVDRQSGRVIWRLGGKHNDFRLDRRGHFAFQHHVVMHPGGRMTIFDNEAGPPNEARESRGLVLQIDERRRRASFVRQYVHHPSVLSPALGSVQELDNGHTFIGWGDSSWFTDYDSRGRVVLDGHLAPGCISYRAFLEQWTGRPRTPPRTAVKRVKGGARLYASWNGATEHRRWRVLSGPNPGALRQSGVVEVKGFETEILVRHPGAWLAVEALDGAGRVLGRSAPSRV